MRAATSGGQRGSLGLPRRVGRAAPSATSPMFRPSDELDGARAVQTCGRARSSLVLWQVAGLMQAEGQRHARSTAEARNGALVAGDPAAVRVRVLAAASAPLPSSLVSASCICLHARGQCARASSMQLAYACIWISRASAGKISLSLAKREIPARCQTRRRPPDSRVRHRLPHVIGTSRRFRPRSPSSGSLSISSGDPYQVGRPRAVGSRVFLDACRRDGGAAPCASPNT